MTGKIESGVVSRGDALLLMPNKAQVEAVALYLEEREVGRVRAGDNVKIKLLGVDEKVLW